MPKLRNLRVLGAGCVAISNNKSELTSRSAPILFFQLLCFKVVINPFTKPSDEGNLRLLLMCVLSWISVVVCLGVVRTIRGVGGPFGVQGIGGGGGGP